MTNYAQRDTIRLRLKEILKESGISQIELSKMTGIGVATIANLVNNRTNTINRTQLLTIMKALDIENFNYIIEVKASK